MPGTQSTLQKEGETSPKKLVSSVLNAWILLGVPGVSARNIAAMAGVPVSSIYHHFGDMEHLLEFAQSEARRRARDWCDTRLAAIRGPVRGPAALGSLLAATVDDWCETQRDLAFAWREAQLMSLRDTRHRPERAQWGRLWQDFWVEACNHLDIPDMGPSTAWLFDGLASLHLLRWRRPLDRAALEEMCHGWAAWLQGRSAAPSPWFELARSEALVLAEAQPPVLDDPIVAAIGEAAAHTIQKLGVAGLTHRAVAAEAGVTLGVVSYKFRTSADLLNAAFEAIYRRLTPRLDSLPEAQPRLSREEGLAAFDSGYVLRDDVLGLEELMVAAARGTGLEIFAAQLRYLRGKSSGRYFQALFPSDRPIGRIDAAIFSAFLTGRGNVALCTGEPPTRAEVAPLLARLGCT